MKTASAVGLFFAVLVLPTHAYAQVERFDLGQRVRAFESAWEAKKPDESEKKRAATALKNVVTRFFSLRLGESGRNLDEARLRLTLGREPDANERWAAALSLRPQTRLLDASAGELTCDLVAFYPPKVDQPASARLRLSLTDAAGRVLAKPSETRIGEIPQRLSMKLAGVPAGDHWLVAEILVGEEPAAPTRHMISFIREPGERLGKLRAFLDENKDVRLPEVETVRSHHLLLNNLLDQRTFETNYPANALFAEAEYLAAAVRDGKRDVLKQRPGEYWLTLPTVGRRTSLRLFAPDAVTKGKAVPLVIALHGAGGSENMFFEAYGAGAIVGLCRQRGWLLVAPRGEGFARRSRVAELIEEIGNLYPVDTSRVFLVGHSLGAAQALAAVSVDPGKIAAVALLGGSGRLATPEAAKAIPFFVGCGTEDFALSGARSLVNTLKKVEGLRVEFKEYPDIEHMAIVQVALPDVFAFFDAVSRRRP